MPLLIMPELITERISPNQQGWAYSIWLHILHLQLKTASRNRLQFREGIKVNKHQNFITNNNSSKNVQDIDKMSPGEIMDEVSKRELRFRNVCNLAITEMRSSDQSRKIGHKKTTTTVKNKKDRREFLGQELPSMADALPKYFDHPKTKV